MSGYPIPAVALDDRLAFVGSSGSGKTYNAGGGVELLLASKARAVIIDPLGVWWGLRLRADGEAASRFKVVIFGGRHGDLPLTEHAGALIGEAVAGMAESCIIDLSEIGTAAGERRFMLNFLRALYQKRTGEPLHLVLDEADMWAPQTIRDKDGDANKLFAITERIIRRGRVDGFIPWQITQRPAELSKSVLSMAEGLVAFSLTSPQDRDALDGWVKGQADVEEGKRIKASLPTLQKGEGVVWIPRRGILKTSQFPLKVTYDSSRTPKRGEVVRRTDLKPLDVGALQARLATVEAEVKANDPRALKAENIRLTRELAAAQAKTGAPDPAALSDAEERGYVRGVADGNRIGAKQALTGIAVKLQALASEALVDVEGLPPPAAAPKAVRTAPRPPVAAPAPKAAPAPPSGGDAALTGPQRLLMTGLAWWAAMGHAAPTRTQLAAKIGWAPKGSTLRARLSELNTAGLVEYPEAGKVRMTAAGAQAAPAPDLSDTLTESVRRVLTGPQTALFDQLMRVDGKMTRADLAAAVGWEAGGSTLRARLSELHTLEIVEYPAKGEVRLQDWVTG